jgi:hypothetical protein
LAAMTGGSVKLGCVRFYQQRRGWNKTMASAAVHDSMGYWDMAWARRSSRRDTKGRRDKVNKAVIVGARYPNMAGFTCPSTATPFRQSRPSWCRRRLGPSLGCRLPSPGTLGPLRPRRHNPAAKQRSEGPGRGRSLQEKKSSLSAPQRLDLARGFRTANSPQ